MSPVPNPRVLFNDIPTGKLSLGGFPEPGKTTIYDDSQTIDLETVEIPEGGFLVKTLWLSVDPYMRGRMRDAKIQSYTPAFALNQPLNGHGVGVVLRSKNGDYKEGAHVYGFFSHQAYIVYPNKGDLIVIENKEGLPWSYYVGVTGMPGKTAYHAWNEHSHAKKGETAFVTTGGGPVGSFVIQLAKLSGCRVIASAGSAEKVEFMKGIGADVAFNYKEENTLEVLKREGGIDIYWDNVGGETLDAALEAAKGHARFIECGMISGYNNGGVPIKNAIHIVSKSLSINGFIVTGLQEKYDARFYAEIPQLVADGKLEYKEEVFEGLESVGDAILAVQKGTNKAKAVVRVAKDA